MATKDMLRKISRSCTVDHLGNVPIKKLGELPESQASAWRHKCAACAYALGFEEGQKDIENRVVRNFGQSLGLGAHRH